jgi:hypothetical protein
MTRILEMWPRLVAIAAGIWLMIAPDALDYSGPARTASYIIGPVAATFAAIAISEVTRSVRWVNAAAGITSIVLPWIYGYPADALISSIATGAILLAVAVIRGPVHGRYGGGWPALAGKGG